MLAGSAVKPTPGRTAAIPQAAGAGAAATAIQGGLVPHLSELIRASAGVYHSLVPQTAGAAAAATWRWLVLLSPELGRTLELELVALGLQFVLLQ